MRLSWSQCMDLLSCPACYSAKRQHHAPRRISPSLVIGSSLHGAAAALRKGASPDDARDAAVLEAGRCMAGEDREGVMGDVDPVLDLGSKYGSWSDVENRAMELLPHLAAIIESEKGCTILGVEQQLSFTDVFACDFLGFADVILAGPAGVTIKDLKSSAQDSAPDITAWLQLAAYSLADGLSDAHYGGIDQLVTTKTPKVHTWLEQGFAGRISELRGEAVNIVNYAAEVIQRGLYPIGNPKYGHDVQHASTFYLIPDEVAV